MAKPREEMLRLWLGGVQVKAVALGHGKVAGQPHFRGAAAAAAKSLQSCLTLCDPIDGLLPGPSVPGILQARTLEWVAISFIHNCMILRVIKDLLLQHCSHFKLAC